MRMCGEGCVWVYTDVYGCVEKYLRVCMGVYGCVRVCIGKSMGVYECLYHVQKSTDFSRSTV